METAQCRGRCPVCGGENLRYGAMEVGSMGDTCYHPFTCPDCGTVGEEWYVLEYSLTDYRRKNE
ncbi:MAG: hypothetical protein ACXQT3_02230 [Methermicoccaceae archaeon]